jgi:uncharacterized membrane protein
MSEARTGQTDAAGQGKLASGFWLVIAHAAATLGLAVSLALSVARGGGSVVGCPDDGGCGRVLASSYSLFLGVPVACYGVVYYTAALSLLAVAARSWWGLRLLVGLAGVGVAASLMLLAVQGLLVKAWCPLCLTSAMATVLLAVSAVSLFQFRRTPPGSVATYVASSTAWIGVAWAMLLLIQRSVTNGDDVVLARFDGTDLTLKQMREDRPEELEAIDESAYAARRRWALDKMLGIAMEHEARKRGMGRDKLYELEVEEKIAPKLAEAEAAGRAVEPAKRREFVQQLKDDARHERLSTWSTELLGQHRSRLLIQPPYGARVALEYERAHVLGPADAPVTLAVFGDYQCPICMQLDRLLRGLRKEYPGRVRIAYFTFPLEQHELAVRAGAAVERAAGAGTSKLAEVHEALVDAGGSGLTAAKLTELESGLPADPQAERKVGASRMYAKSLGLNGAPEVFVNGRRLLGVDPTDERACLDLLRAAVERSR